MGFEQGVTHYTHWFQPLTGTTAENDAFETSYDGSDPVEKFGADNWFNKNQMHLVSNGGIRNTF
jgi:glutamine synthetase